ncbi:hypothetical protein ABEB36_006498 [Hypothenemus hampei]|uniref:Uncharacterized protein n=1 Tax=Hypothenemus hampei TaxID=57062 RepID=A0ABD1EUN5_HYPHA
MLRDFSTLLTCLFPPGGGILVFFDGEKDDMADLPGEIPYLNPSLTMKIRNRKQSRVQAKQIYNKKSPSLVRKPLKYTSDLTRSSQETDQ